jgi:ankyrin repeat protein
VDNGINLTTDELDTPLSLALMASNVPNPALIELLLSRGASTNSILSSGQTVLYDFLSKLIPSEGQMKAACAILRSVEAETLKAFGGEFLANFARNGQSKIAKCLLARAEKLGISLEMDKNVHDAAGWGLSHYASRRDHCLSEYLPVLLRMASNTLSKTSDGCSELYLAAFNGNESGLRLALDCTNSRQFIDTRTTSGLTPLHAALRNRHVSVASILLGSGASLDLPDNLGRTPLFNTVDVDSPEAVTLILLHLGLRSRLMLDNPCLDGLSALHLAVKRENLPIIRILVGSWAEFDIPNDEGDAILQSACKSGNTSIIKLLTESGLVGSSNISVNPMLNIASINNHTEQVLPPLLKAVGVGPNFQFTGICSESMAFNFECQKPFGRSLPRPRTGKVLALSQKHKGYEPEPQSQFQTMLKALNPSPLKPSYSTFPHNQPFGDIFPVDTGSTAAFEVAIDGREHFNSINERIGLTPLHVAAIADSVHTLGKIIDKDGGQLDAQTKDGRNALHLSLAAGSANASKLLVERGINCWPEAYFTGGPSTLLPQPALENVSECCCPMVCRQTLQ